MNDASETIVITGAGLVSGLGLSREETWQAILAGRCAFRPLTTIESPLPLGADGGQDPELPDDFAPALPREARYLKWAIADALRDASAFPAIPYPAARCACLLGTTLHGMRAAGRFFRSNDYSVLGDFLAGNTLQLATEGLGFSGLAATTCSACSSSLASIALAVTLLESHQVDLVIAGGYDALGEYVYGGFNSLRLVARGPVKPFTRNREGMKLAEGYGIVILERSGDAAGGVTPLASILGWGESADAHHLTQPDPKGDGAARAMLQALTRAGLTAADIDLIAAHATGTPDNDAGEYAAFSRVFGDRLSQIPVVAFKSHLGHTLGGAGAVELILSAMALRDQTVPGCANVTADEVEFPNLCLATGKPRKVRLRTSLNTSLGFGGANACVILGPAKVASSGPRAPFRPAAEVNEVCITGIGVILPGILGNDAMLARLRDGSSPAWQRDAGAVPEAQLLGLLNTRRVRRMSDYVKLTLAATTLAVQDAGITDVPAFASNCGVLLGTMHGSSNFSVDYYSQIVKEGLIAANPLLFAEGVPNAGAAQLSLMLSVKGACQTIIGNRTSGLDALALAAARIRVGVWDRAIVGAGEEYCPLVCEAHRRCGSAALKGSAPFAAEPGFVIGAGAVTLILESRKTLEQRRRRPRGWIDAAAFAFGNRSQTPRAVRTVLEQLNHPANVLSSACGGWIDRAEAIAIREGDGIRSVSSIYGHVAETFSVSPLVGIAATLLAGAMPRLLGDGWNTGDAVRPATGEEPVDSFAAICTDLTGAVSGLGITRF